MSPDAQATAAKTDPHSRKGKEVGELNQGKSFTAESKSHKQTLVVSLEVETQEGYQLWQERTAGGLKKERALDEEQ